MNRHALRVIEFPQALERVAGYAAGPLGAAAVRSLEPSDSPAIVVPELRRVDQAMRLCTGEPEWAAPAVPDVREPLRALAVAGSVLDAGALRKLAVLMATSRSVRRFLLARASTFDLLAELAGRMHEFEAEERAVGAAIDESGDVRDTATRELNHIRRELRSARGRIVQRLEAFMAELPERFRVSDASVTLRDGRYVIPIRREGRGEVGGIVHDESSTGQTIFVEPPVAIELMNRLRELELAETREVHRILTTLTDGIRPRARDLRTSLEALIEVDSVMARARYALDHGGHVPEIVTRGDGEYRVVRGYHPLLLGTAENVVPFDLELDPEERTLLVSGPNTGGKTVLLKAIGLISALAQAGVVPPVGAGTRLPLFRDLFADIGDEQSIEASLSTFSAHLKNLREILEHADSESLVLIDEIGSGTDPLEGAALARAILTELTHRGARTVATTHLGELKRLAGEEPGVVNASLQFDAVELRPTYRLVKGVPGRSYGIAIARRLGFPEPVLARAEAHVPEDERRAERLLAELEEKNLALAEALAEATAAREAALALQGELEERDRTWRRRARELEREAREEARRILLGARTEVDEAIRALRDEAAAARTESELEAAARAARRRVEVAARREGARAAAVPESESRPADAISPGTWVRIAATGSIGEVREIREGRATVETEGVRLSVPVTGLVAAQAPAPRPAARAGGWSAPEVAASPEVDLRGLRADEVASRLGPALDGAVQAGLGTLRI
ncbi:MAG TPA: hypothetical protein VNZ57_16060, partial [Longimicrobiales bacterium]|nr:hypothetical protein [Longimicrobiales bacterium]